MAATGTATLTKKNRHGAEVPDVSQSRSAPIAERGIRTSKDAAALGFAMCEDAVLGNISPRAVSSACSAMGRGLQSVHMELRCGASIPFADDGGLLLCPAKKERADKAAEIAALWNHLAELKGSGGNAVNETADGARGA